MATSSTTTNSSHASKPVSILFVCLGNICRSTMAEGAFRSLVAYDTPSQHPLISKLDSCGTGAYHTGAAPDSRTLSVLSDHGIKNYSHKARRVRVPQDFREFDYVLAMDVDNAIDLRQEVKRAKAKGVFSDEEAEEALGKVRLYGEFGSRGQMAKKRSKTRSGKGGRAVEEDDDGEEVQDPYYGGNEGFTTAWEQLDRFGKGLIAHIEEEARKGEADEE